MQSAALATSVKIVLRFMFFSLDANVHPLMCIRCGVGSRTPDRSFSFVHCPPIRLIQRADRHSDGLVDRANANLHAAFVALDSQALRVPHLTPGSYDRDSPASNLQMDQFMTSKLDFRALTCGRP